MTFVAASIARFGLYAYSDVMPHGNYPTEEQVLVMPREYTIGMTRSFIDSTDGVPLVHGGNTEHRRSYDVLMASNDAGYQEMMIDDKFVMKMHTLSAKYYTNRKPCNTR